MGTSTEKIEIKIDGKSYEKKYNFLNIKLTQELLKPNELCFTMQKKDLLESEDDSSFSLPKELLGAKVTLLIQTARYDQKAEQKNEILEFNGIIFKVNAYRNEMIAELMFDIQAYSNDYLLMDNQHCYSYEDKSLDEIVTETIAPYSFPVEIEPKTEASIPYTVQYNETNYQFLIRLAQRYGEWMYYDGTKWIFGKVKKEDSLELFPRVDILNYRYAVDLRHHTLKHGHHDYLEYENPVKSDKDVKDLMTAFNELTDPAKKKSESLFTKETFRHLQCSNPEDNTFDELKVSLDAQLLGSKAQQTICTGTTVRADLHLGSCFKIKDFFDKNNNKLGYHDHDELLVCRIVHTANVEGNYRNEFMAIPSKSQFPPYYNSDVFPVVPTQRAKVIDNKDPEKLGRIRVQFLWQQEQDDTLMTPWIRIAQPYAGDGKGFLFIPEIDEEVMVGFENGNAEKPYMIGSLYHGKQKPRPGWFGDDDNRGKTIRSRSGQTIQLVDWDKTGDEHDGCICIWDNPHENYDITFSSHDKLIELICKGDIVLNAGGDILLNAGGNVKINAGNNLSETAGDDIFVNAGGGMTTDVKGNNLLLVGGEMFVDVTSNSREKVGGEKTIWAEGKMDVVANGSTLHLEGQDIEIKGHSSIKEDGGSLLDLYAGKIRIN